MTSLMIVLEAECQCCSQGAEERFTGSGKAIAAHRSEIATLKRKVKTLRSTLKASEKAVKAVASGMPVETDRPCRKVRLSAQGFAAQRAKLGFSRAQIAQLIGAPTLSIYKWESGKVHPRVAQLERIAAVRKLGKRAAARLT